MNTGQMLLALGAVILVGLIVLRNSNVNIRSTEMVTESKIKILMIDFAQSVLEEISSRRFDEASVNAPINNLSQFTAPNGLKIDAGENKNNIRTFDDYDDFNRDSTNGYTFDTVYNQIPLKVRTKVYYVVPTNVALPVSSTRQFYKKADVTVYVNPNYYTYMKNEKIQLTRIFSFFQF